MHKSSKCLEKYAGVILFRPEYAGVSSGVEKIAPDFCRSKKIYSGRSSVWSPLNPEKPDGRTSHYRSIKKDLSRTTVPWNLNVI